jgi:feruloyl esterase
MTGGMITLGPTLDAGQRAPYWDHKDLNFNSQNIYSSKKLAAQNPLGLPDPISIEDEFLLTFTGSEPIIGSDDYQGVLDNVYEGPKHGKIIMWQGGADNQVFWQDGLRYYRSIATLFGGGKTDFAGLSSWFRYYHAPGVGHCGGGVGASPLTNLPDGNSQIFEDLMHWVENGTLPQSAGDSTHVGILATGPGSFGTRPICPWPTTAIYKGTGPSTVASNYICGGDLDAFPPTPANNNVATICQGLVTRGDNPHSNSLDYKEQGVSPSQCPNP